MSSTTLHRYIGLLVRLVYLLAVQAVGQVCPQELSSHSTSITRNELKQYDASLLMLRKPLETRNKDFHPAIPIPANQFPPRRNRIYISHPPNPTNATHTLTLTLSKIIHYSSPTHSQDVITFITAILERIYDTLAYTILAHGFLDEHNLTVRVGAFTLDFYCVAEFLSAVAVKAVVKRLGQMVQKGLTGLVVGGVVDVETGVRTLFAFGVLVGVEGG